MFSVVEPCIAPMVKGNKATKKLEVTMANRKCVWVYHYFDDSEFGFGHVRLQSWVPFNVFICLNGRHWLERQLQDRGIGYIKDGNCFPWIKDISSAQKLLDGQLKRDWKQMLNRLAFGSCPALDQVLRPLRPDYYWSADETEWATDIMFKSKEALDALYPSLLHHAMHVSDSGSVMKYLGGRNHKAFQNAAYLLKNLGLTEGQAWPILRHWNCKNKPPLPEWELRQALRNANIYGRHPVNNKVAG